MTISETDRVKALQELHVTDTVAEPEFDRLVRLVTHVANAEAGQICFIDDCHQFVKALDGVDFPRKVPREDSMCVDVIRSGKPLLIENLAYYSRPVGREIVKNFGLRSYVGIPIVMPNGAAVGVLSAMSFHHQLPSTRRVAALQDLASLTKRELMIRKAKAKADAPLVSQPSSTVSAMTQTFRSLAQSHFAVLRSIEDGIIGIRQDGHVNFMNPAAERMLGRPAAAVLDKPFPALLAGNDAGTDRKACEALAACLQDRQERFVRAAHLLRGNGEALPVEFVATPIAGAGNSVVAFVVFREGGANATSGIALRESVKEISRLREQIERLKAREQETMGGGQAAPLGADHASPPGIHDLLAAIQQEEAGQIMRASALCNGQIDGTQGAALLLDMTAELMRQKLAAAESGAGQSSRISRWLVDAYQTGAASRQTGIAGTAHQGPATVEGGSSRTSRIERWLSDAADGTGLRPKAGSEKRG